MNNSIILNYNNKNLIKKKKIIINISGSKSESNRLLIIKKLFNKLELINLSNSNDTKIMINSLKKEKKNKINIKDAGTVMRFLISYFTITIKNKKKKILTGSKRMKNRPIFYLVESLKEIGAKIKYLKKKGYPPIKIIGNKIKKNKIYIKSNISSQYITSLILIAPKLNNGLKIYLSKKKISFSYIKMTINILKKLNFKIKYKKNIIIINNKKEIKKKKYYIESDWSSASYFYSIITLINYKNIKLILKYFKKKSLQGDSIIVKIYKKYFGIKTKFFKKKILIYKNKKFKYPKFLKLNLKSTPDIAQTIILTCSALKIKCLLTGLQTLKIKETDRLKALKKELKKNGTITKINNKSIKIIKFIEIKQKKKIIIETYKDHRMAMAFSVLAIKNKNLIIKNPNTVNKSYPNFWKDLKELGFNYKYN
ncbi:MAG: 3-phosphoshikimate 1-carboxyvinyltransferase [Candidatus Shikimatogenerans bostrichidophilus]|nr:MAG: 3-phosphoshikimate 1-carboxyvinyltransferase [Candidatus Shikimatogenerans bostrichidophilus]